MPNAFAFLVLFTWPMVALYLKKKFDKTKAVALAVLLPYLFLPEGTGIDLPGLPLIDKYSMISLAAFFLFLFKNKEFIKLPDNGFARFIFIVMIFMPLGVIATNGKPLVYVENFISAVRPYDFVAMSFENFVSLYVPFMLGVIYFRTEESQKVLLEAFMLVGLVYSVLMLYEVRMSPQLHINIYGFFPHSFAQQFRAGGFRPVVFLGHGLNVALFASYLAIIACYLYKYKIKYVSKWPGITCIYLIAVTALCKTWSAGIYLILFLPLIFLVSPKRQLQACLIVVGIVFFYPLLRIVDAIPVWEFHDFVAQYNEERAESFAFRLENEDILLEKANDKALFGWGGWGRSKVYSAETGASISIQDGFWILIYGVWGLVGYFVYYGLYCYPIYLYSREANRSSDENAYRMTIALVLILCVILIDCIPNAGRTSLTTLLAGAVMGRAIELKKLNGKQRTYK